MCASAACKTTSSFVTHPDRSLGHLDHLQACSRALYSDWAQLLWMLMLQVLDWWLSGLAGSCTWHRPTLLLLLSPCGTVYAAEAAHQGITPNTRFLTNYLKGVESGNKRAIARNAARGAQRVGHWQDSVPAG